MQIDSFIASHRPAWQRLDELGRRLRRRRSRVEPADADEFLALAERASSHLSHARRRYDDADLTTELTGLVAAANAEVYRRTSPPGSAVRRFFTSSFPGAVWRVRRSLLVAFVATFLPACIVALWLSSSDAALDVAAPEAARAAYVEEDFENYYSSTAASQFATSVLINNVQVSFTAYAVGVAFGLGSILVLAYNGVILGQAWALFIVAEQQGRFFGLILPHGLLELSAIVVAGAAGFAMGWALVAPGDLGRGEAFALEARRSVTIILGLVLVFVAAGLIEGFVTPSLPLVPRIAIGVAAFVAFWTYVVTLGSRAEVLGLAAFVDDDLEGEQARTALAL